MSRHLLLHTTRQLPVASRRTLSGRHPRGALLGIIGARVRVGLPALIPVEGGSSSRPSFASRREITGLSSLSSWVEDVVRTRSLQPPNPILASLSNDNNNDDDDEKKKKNPQQLPQFAHMLPYHLESAALEVKRQYRVDVAELEVSLTGVQAKQVVQDGLLQQLDEIEAPVAQIMEVGRLYSELASSPDQSLPWKAAYQKTKQIVSELPWRESKIIYEHLYLPVTTTPAPASLKLDYRKQGAHVSDPDVRAECQGWNDELQRIRQRVQRLPPFAEQVRAQRLQLVSDLYNLIGLSQLQAKQLGHPNVSSMHQCQNLATPREILGLAPKVASFLRPHLPSAEATLDANAGAFLGGSSDKNKGPSDRQVELWKAKHQAKQLLRLNGVLQGMADFWDAMFGIRVEYEADAGWNPNVRLLHLYDTDSDVHLGSIYLDPFRDPYYRTETANELALTRLFSQVKSQTQVPVAVVALRISPTWDDVPTPLTWEDTRELLYQLGKALQSILSQSKAPPGTEPPKDVSEFMATFMEMWIQNDGFLQRLAQLSQAEEKEEKRTLTSFEPETMECLRDDMKKQKALEIMHSAFLGSLELSIFTDFDPRGDETLAALQGRLAEEYLPHEVPDSNDLTFLLELFQEEDDTSAYSPLYSEILAAMVFDKFQNTDLRHRDEVERLGRGLRDLFLRESILTKEDFEKLCERKISPDALKRVYKF